MAGAVIVAGAEAAGDMLSISIGLSGATIFNPTNGGQTMVLGQFMQLLAVTLLLTAGGHVMMLQALAETFRVLPLGTPVNMPEGARALATTGATIFGGCAAIRRPGDRRDHAHQRVTRRAQPRRPAAQHLHRRLPAADLHRPARARARAHRGGRGDRPLARGVQRAPSRAPSAPSRCRERADMAKDGPGGEKTEEASGRKLEEARNDGQIAKSPELMTAAFLLGMTVTLDRRRPAPCGASCSTAMGESLAMCRRPVARRHRRRAARADLRLALAGRDGRRARGQRGDRGGRELRAGRPALHRQDARTQVRQAQPDQRLQAHVLAALAGGAGQVALQARHRDARGVDHDAPRAPRARDARAARALGHHEHGGRASAWRCSATPACSSSCSAAPTTATSGGSGSKTSR